MPTLTRRLPLHRSGRGLAALRPRHLMQILAGDAFDDGLTRFGLGIVILVKADQKPHLLILERLYQFLHVRTFQQQHTVAKAEDQVTLVGDRNRDQMV